MRLSSASQSGFLAGSPETSELSLFSPLLLLPPPPGGVVAEGTGSGSDGLLPVVPDVFAEEDVFILESSEDRRIPFLSPLEDERLPSAS